MVDEHIVKGQRVMSPNSSGLAGAVNQSPVIIEEMYALLKESKEQLTYGEGSRTGLASRIGDLLDRAKEYGINLSTAKSPESTAPAKKTKFVDELRMLTEENSVVHAISEMWITLRVELIEVAKLGEDEYIIYYYNFDHLYKYIDKVVKKLESEGLTVQLDRGLLSHKVTITW